LANARPLYPIRHAVAFGLIGFFACQCLLVASLWIRGSMLQSRAIRASDDGAVAFERVFPEQQAPVGIAARLQSEKRRLMGTRGISKDVPQVQSIERILHVFLSSLPERSEARFRFDRLSFLPDVIESAVGTARSIEEQELIAKRMSGAGLNVPTLSAQKVRNGVELRLEKINIRANDEDDQ
ncbi:MAG: hypothetical protein AAFX06_21230, partial [Planctomycetota bacterium]